MSAAPPTREEKLQTYAESGEYVSVRDLIGLWHARGRGSQNSELIKRDLKRLNLSTEPPFTYGGLGSFVRVVATSSVRSGDSAATAAESPSDEVSETDASMEPPEKLHIGQIPSALAGLKSVTPSTPLALAQTIMIRFDFAQLGVIDSGTLVGVVSWESIAQSSLRQTVSTVGECTTKAMTVSQDDDLLAAIEVIVRSDYVIVIGPDGTPSGIVTTADLAGQFDQVARPFLTVGECELELKRLLDRKFSAEVLHNATRYKKPERPGASAMTIGDIKTFIARSENWNALGISLAHDEFVDWVEILRQLRNEVAHFNQDPEALPNLAQVQTLTAFLRSL